MAAYEHTANTVGAGSSTVRAWVREFETLEYILDSRRGKHSKTDCPILDDLEFREEFKTQVRKTSREQGKIITKDEIMFLIRECFQKLFNINHYSYYINCF